MKSMNVRKIAAIAAGAAMIGAAFVGAVDVDTAGVGSFSFIQAGEPNVKIVVGSTAQPSDAVAAANIAAMIGNLAYKSSPVTVDQSAISCGGAGAGSCTGTLGSQQAVLTVTTPGVNPATAYEMRTYIGDESSNGADNLDSNAETVRNGTTTVGSTNASFGSGLGPRVITKDNTAIVNPAASLASDGKISYPKGSTITKEEQKIYAYAQVLYSTSTNAKKVQAQSVKTGYEAIFTDPIPVCLDTTKNLAGCGTNDKLTKNSVKITFLGDVWTISDVTVASPLVTAVTLGKSIAYKPIMKPGEKVTTPDGFVVELSDISGFGFGTGGSSLPYVSFKIYDKNNNLVKTLTSQQTTGAGDEVAEANNLVIKVNNAFPGASAKEFYADVEMYSNKLVITSGSEVSGGESKKNWKANIVSSNVSSSEGISKIQLYNDVDQTYKTPISQTLNAGESLEIIHGLPGFKLNFLGLETVDYDTLSFTKVTNSLVLVSGSATGQFLLVQSGRSNAFQYNGRNMDSVYLVVNSTNQTAAANGTVLYYDTTNSYFTSTGTTANQMVYQYSSSESATINTNAGLNTSTANQVIIAIPEITEDANGTAAAVTSNYNVVLQYDQALAQFVNTMGSTTVDKVGYQAAKDISTLGSANASNLASKETGFTTRRGNIVTSISATSVSMSYAQKIAHPRFTLTAAATSASAQTADYTLSANATQNIGGGYSVQLKDVSATVAACTPSASEGGALSGDAVASPANADVVTPLDTSSTSLVVLDKDAGSATNLIVVGGPMVNSLAGEVSGTLTTSGNAVVTVSGTKLIVAGYTAADTQAAANSLIAWLSSNRDQVVKG